MKRTIIVSSAAMTVVAAVALFAAKRKHEVDLTPTEIANIEALTQGEGYVEYDKNCQNGGKQICVPNPYQIIYDQIIYP